MYRTTTPQPVATRKRPLQRPVRWRRLAVHGLACLAILAIAHTGWAQNRSPGSRSTDNRSPDTDPKTDNATQIKTLLQTQADCWNRGDIEGFMQTYWKSKDLTFSGGGKTTRGWHATLERYRQAYPRESMGQLTFDHLEITFPAESVALVLGEWHLKNQDQDEPTERNGNFTLVLKVFPEGWKIIHDHSSTRKPDADE